MSTRITIASKYHPLHKKRRHIAVPFGTQRFLAALEGLEGGFAIGASVVVALSFTGMTREAILVTAIVTIIVNGFNNASVKYATEHYMDELDGVEKRSALKHYFVPSLIEFIAYFLISFISIVPLFFIADLRIAIIVSVIVTLIILWLAGYWRGYVLHMSRVRDAAETVMLGAGIIVVGLLSGYAIHVFQLLV